MEFYYPCSSEKRPPPNRGTIVTGDRVTGCQ